MKNIRNKQYKWCWVAKEVNGGWRLSLHCNSFEYKLTKAVFTTIEEVKMVTGTKGKIVFVHLKNTKF